LREAPAVDLPDRDVVVGTFFQGMVAELWNQHPTVSAFLKSSPCWPIFVYEVRLMDWRDFGFAVIGFLLGVSAAFWILIFIASRS
jgi:hypothetical protein